MEIDLLRADPIKSKNVQKSEGIDGACDAGYFVTYTKLKI